MDDFNFNNSPFRIGQVLVRITDYQTATIDNVDYRSTGWYFLVNFGDERMWLAASTIRNQGFVPIEETY